MRTILLFSLFILIAVSALAQNPDGRGYIEPRLRLGAGTGLSKSDLGNFPIKWELDNADVGFSLVSLTPIREHVSLIVNPYYSYSRLRNVSGSARQTVHRFGAEIGVRFYLK